MKARSITAPSATGIILPAATLLAWAIAMLASTVGSAAAVEQCRFIQARADREACYQRQDAELAAKRKPAEPRRDTMMESLEQMKREDETLNRQIHGICRGC